MPSAGSHGEQSPLGGLPPERVGRVVVDPPDTIAGQATAPVARAAMIWVVPWMLVILLVLGGVVFSLYRLGVVLARTSAAEGAAA